MVTAKLQPDPGNGVGQFNHTTIKEGALLCTAAAAPTAADQRNTLPQLYLVS